MNDTLKLFPDCYDDSLARFRLSLETVRSLWPEACLFSNQLSNHPDLTLDWIEAHAVQKPERVIILTAGQHGIEGFAGSAVQQLFLREFMGRLDPARTGLVLVHAINPWGMLHRRKTNSQNVDLNRNFSGDPAVFEMDKNPDFSKLSGLLANNKPVPPPGIARLEFIAQLLAGAIQTGPSRLQKAALLGQHRHPKSIYYGGQKIQEETRRMMDLYDRMAEGYGQFLLIDLHTGFGPRYRMSLVNSSLETRSSDCCMEEYGYPRVVITDASEFYQIEGDMIDYLYSTVKTRFPNRRFYACTFEFGTFGDSTLDGIRSLRAMVLESRLAACGASNGCARDWVQKEFHELYYPAEEKWREKAIRDARQALTGILAAESHLI